MSELSVIGLFATELGQEKERLVCRVQEVADNVDCNEQNLAEIYKKRVA